MTGRRIHCHGSRAASSSSGRSEQRSTTRSGWPHSTWTAMHTIGISIWNEAMVSHRGRNSNTSVTSDLGRQFATILWESSARCARRGLWRTTRTGSWPC
uniref:Uncharacterized protein n=1 Tax=Arundo donax TaxID=35708 RepID=A0A0A9H689_ARUDO